MAPERKLIRIRMYRQGLGDCFLLTFYTGPQPVHWLVDCGTLGATTTGVKIQDVVEDIAAETKGHLQLLIATHEHKDHVSGFNSAREVFDRIDVDRVWLAWTENPRDPLAKKVAKFKGDLKAALCLADAAFTRQAAASDSAGGTRPGMATAVRNLLSFYGDVPDDGAPLGAAFAETIQAAMSYASRKAGKQPEYLQPGQVLEPDWLPGIRIFVMGPPRSAEALTVLGTHESPELYHLTTAMSQDLARSLAFQAADQPLADYRSQLDPEARRDFEAGLPFDACYRIETSDTAARASFFGAYDDNAAAWRRIDHDWLDSTGQLALQLDNATNNTSLALAIEIIEDGRVLVLPGDAQLGNWLSWAKLKFIVKGSGGKTETITAADLLKRAAFYKVGHHASHNATLKDGGLEAMVRDDLVAMIPVDRQVALKKEWQMPATALYNRLLEKATGRVLRSDTGWPTDEERPPSVTAAEWAAARAEVDIEIAPLFIEYRLNAQ